MDEEKKRLWNEMRQIFQESYDDLIEEIERLKKELAPGDKLPITRNYVLSLGDVRTVLNALIVFKSALEDQIDNAALDSTEYFELDAQYESTKELIGFVEEVIRGRGTLIFKRSA